MAALLGDRARFVWSERTINLTEWIGRGIDTWVWAAVTTLRSLLLSGSRKTSTISAYGKRIPYFFRYLIGDRTIPRIALPTEFSPIHIQHFAGWLQAQEQENGWTPQTTRNIYNCVKAVLLEMFNQGAIQGEPARFFKRGTLPWNTGTGSRQTSLSEAEQLRLAQAIKADIVNLHHRRLTLNGMHTQALRLLLVAHRQGLNPTPLLEMQRDAMKPGIMPGTVRIRTAKHRNKKTRSSLGRATAAESIKHEENEQDLIFALNEGTILQQAIMTTADLVSEAPPAYKNRTWLYRSAPTYGDSVVTCLSPQTLKSAITALVDRHQLCGDDGKPLRINLSRLRKSFFDRAFKQTDGDLIATANLMGNTPIVAGSNYPTMNGSRSAEAANFMNSEFINIMRPTVPPVAFDVASQGERVMKVQLITPDEKNGPASLTMTAMAGCVDTLHGKYAPQDGYNHCDRYVMCLFCPSFAIVGSVHELWRLFSFQVFAQRELNHLDATLGPERTADDLLESLRDRYRLAIPWINEFTTQQFAARNVEEARTKTAVVLHPYWVHQIKMGDNARNRGIEANPGNPAASATD